MKTLPWFGGLILALAWGAGAAQPPAKTGAPEPAAKRRVYVLHSGVHTILANPDKNIAAIQIGLGLMKRGVSARDVVWLENPFPHAEKWNPFPPKCAMLFGDYCKPTSRPCTETYLHMHYALQ